MIRFIVGAILDRHNRNGINDNFKYLFDSQKRTASQLDDLVLSSGGSSNAEVVQARGGRNTLDARLREMEDYREVVVSKEEPTNASIWFEVL